MLKLLNEMISVNIYQKMYLMEEVLKERFEEIHDSL